MRITEGQKQLIIVLIVTPIVLIPLIFIGLYAGSMLSFLGLPPYVMQSIFSTLGFIAGLYIVIKAIVFMVNRNSKSTS